MKTSKFIQNSLEDYFDGEHTGVDLLNSLKNIPDSPLIHLASVIASLSPKGRVYFFGNGGSFDNACSFVNSLHEHGINASVPAIESGYFDISLKKSYSEIYREGLIRSLLQPEDIVVGLSGSGNSENVNRALEYAQQKGVKTFCFGGRDGGKMAEICGQDQSIIVLNDSMEAIEDLHLACSFLLKELMKGKKDLDTLKANLVERTSKFLRKNIETSLPNLVQSILRTINEESRLFIVGHTISANHFRADMMRGATARIPIRGINAPELFSINSFQATANDDGIDDVLVRGLMKHTPHENDFCLLFSLPQAHEATNLCEKELKDRSIPLMRAGCCTASEDTIDLSDFSDIGFDFGLSIVGHSVSVAINSLLNQLWDVQPIDIVLPKELQGRKKLNKQETLDFEKYLKEKKLLDIDRILSFCYGKMFSVKMPIDGKTERFFY